MKRFFTFLKTELKLSLRDMNMPIFAVIMPPVMQKIVGVFPLTQGIAMMKYAFVGGQMENILLPVFVMLGLTILCTGLAVRFFRWE